MPTVTIANLASIGFVPDKAAVALPPEAWSQAHNVRAVGNAWEKVEGWRHLYGSVSDIPLSGIIYQTSKGYPYLHYGSATKLYVTLDGATWTDVSKVATTYSATVLEPWRWTNAEGLLLAVNPVDIPQVRMFPDTIIPAQDLPNWPENLRCRVIRAYRSYLIALNLTIDGVHYAQLLRWSHPADPGQVPSSWDITDPTVDAGEYNFSQTPGAVVDLLPLGDMAIVYKTDQVWGMQYVGGIAVFQFRLLFDTFGALNTNCVASFTQGAPRHVVLTTTGDVMLHNGITAQSIATDRVRKYLRDNLSGEYTNNSFVVAHPQHQEIWICFPTLGNVYCNRALIWNYANNVWSTRDLPALSGAVSGPITSYASEEAAIDASTPWAAMGDTTWLDGGDTPWVTNLPLIPYAEAQPQLVGFRQIGAVHLDSTPYTDGEDFWLTLERTELAIVGKDQTGAPRADAQSWKLCTEVWPQLYLSATSLLKWQEATTITWLSQTKATWTDAVDVYVGSQMDLNQAVVWKGPYAFQIGQKRKVNPLVSGRYLAIRIHTARPITLDAYDLRLNLVGKYR